MNCNLDLHKLLQDAAPFKDEDKGDLEQLLRNPTMLAALKAIRDEAREQAEGLATFDLSEDTAKAIQRQGAVLGLNRALDILQDLLED